MAQKNIRFDYFAPCLQETEDVPCDLLPHLELLSTLSLSERTIPFFSGHSIRLSQIKEYTNYQPEGQRSPFSFPLWYLAFSRLRPDVPGVTTTASSDIDPLYLAPDQHLAEDIVGLYDPETLVLLLQRNRLGAPPSAIKKFFNDMFPESDFCPEICFQPIIMGDALKRATQLGYSSSFTVRMTNTRRDDIKYELGKQPEIGMILAAANAFATDDAYPIKAEFTISIPGKNPERTFKEKAIKSVIKTLNSLIPIDAVDRLVVKGRQTEESPMEEIDLVGDFLREWISFPLKENRFIASITIFDQLALAYSKKRDRFLVKK